MDDSVLLGYFLNELVYRALLLLQLQLFVVFMRCYLPLRLLELERKSADLCFKGTVLLSKFVVATIITLCGRVQLNLLKNPFDVVQLPESPFSVLKKPEGLHSQKPHS